MITEGQIKVIGYIQSNLGIKFNGSTSKEAWEFVMEHMEASKASRIPSPEFWDVMENDSELDFDAHSFDMFDPI